MTEEEIKSEMRLYAIEVYVSNLFAMSCLMTPSPMEYAETVRRQMTAGARQRAFPEVGDAALSDLLSAELEAAVTRLAGMASEQISVALRNRRGSTGAGA
jgi:hypothetical protein